VKTLRAITLALSLCAAGAIVGCALEDVSAPDPGPDDPDDVAYYGQRCYESWLCVCPDGRDPEWCDPAVWNCEPYTYCCYAWDPDC